MQKTSPTIKSQLHPRNKHREPYNFADLIQSLPELAPFVLKNKFGKDSINFFDPKAVVCLNKALLKYYYGVQNWLLPDQYLCPPIPGRADYIHYMADLLAENNGGKIPKGSKIKCLDIGVGASCVYPIIGRREYAWSFIASDIDQLSLDSSQSIINNNPLLSKKVKLRIQKNSKNIFPGILQESETIDLCVCNPPFHSSAEQAKKGSLRKQKNLQKDPNAKPVLNFGGQSNELFYPGGEKQFVLTMISQSVDLKKSCYWFSSLVSKKTNLDPIQYALKKSGASEIKVIEMSQGNKVSRLLCWTFLSPEERKEWAKSRWS